MIPDESKRVTELRRYLKKTQEDFAKENGITQGFLSQIESGKKNPSRSLVNKFAKKYGYNVEWHYHGTGQMILKEVKRNPTIVDIKNIQTELNSLVKQVDKMSKDLHKLTRDFYGKRDNSGT